MLVPLYDRIIVSKIKSFEEVNMGGIFLPDTVKETPNMAIVESLGKDAKHVKVGDKILISHLSGIEVSDEGKAYFIIFPNDVLAIL